MSFSATPDRHGPCSAPWILVTVQLWLAACLTVVMAPSASAGDLPMTVVTLSSPVQAFEEANLEIETGWFAVCHLVTRGRTGPYRASGFADAAGRLGWRWRVGPPGLYRLVVTCGKGEDRGELRLSLNVVPRRPGR
jgi:hypothetical protein